MNNLEQMKSDARLEAELSLSLKMVGYKMALQDLKEIIDTPDFPRRITKGFMKSFLTNLEKQMK